jgi:hypothetical protein
MNSKTNTNIKKMRLFLFSALMFALLVSASAQQRPDYPIAARPAVSDQNSNYQQQQNAQYSPQQGMVEDHAYSNSRVPQTLTLSTGTLITIRTNDWLSSDQNRVGDTFSATLDQPVIVDGWVVARRGQTIMGRVSVAQKAGRVKGTSQLGVEMTDLTLVNGQVIPVYTQMVQNSGGTSIGRDVATVGTTTGLGAAIGAAAGDGKGAGIGAGAGALAGIIGVLATPGRQTVIPAESHMTFRIEHPVVINIDRGEMAFQPVSQNDYESASHLSRPRRVVERGYGYPPPARYYAYPAPHYYGPVYYPYYGFGTSFVFIRHRHWR